jgi:tRNA A37 threonylcarbamoyladenosine synthetase subunit TsaC/SUA5/YrdC
VIDLLHSRGLAGNVHMRRCLTQALHCLNLVVLSTRLSHIHRRMLRDDILQTYRDQILLPTSEGILRAAQLIKQGKLVAFPTETVYGLGANAFNADAVSDIFTTKGRPLTDPLIVHVASIPQARELLVLEDDEINVFQALVEKFWPGAILSIIPPNSVISSSSLFLSHAQDH